MTTIDGVNYEDLMIGDIVFVSSIKGVSANANKFWQIANSRKIAKRGFIPTHVAIANGETYSIIHSTSTGVHFSSVASYVDNKSYSVEILVFRNKKLEALLRSSRRNKNSYGDILLRHWGEKYNNVGALLKTTAKGTKFCSELAVEFLLAIAVIDPTIIPSKIYPNDLLNICLNTEEWRQVTPTFLIALNKDFYRKLYWKMMTGKYKTDAHKKSISEQLNNQIKLVEDSISKEKDNARFSNWHEKNVRQFLEIQKMTESFRKQTQEISKLTIDILNSLKNKKS